MHLIYIDDSYDQTTAVYSGIAIPVNRWREVFEQIKEFRQHLRTTYGIAYNYELHAVKFVSGRGSLGIKNRATIVPKAQRAQIFREVLTFITQLPDVRLFIGTGPKNLEERLFERMLNRISRTMQAWDSHAMLICDEGYETQFTRMMRKMAVFNYIPSKYGKWAGAGAAKNIPIERIIEDPFFKPSDASFLIQFADFVAYALLKQERPTANSTKYGIGAAFNIMTAIGIYQKPLREILSILFDANR